MRVQVSCNVFSGGERTNDIHFALPVVKRNNQYGDEPVAPKPSEGQPSSPIVQEQPKPAVEGGQNAYAGGAAPAAPAAAAAPAEANKPADGGAAAEAPQPAGGAVRLSF